MPTESEVRDVLAGVRDPELRRPVTELGMVQGVAVDGGVVALALATPLPLAQVGDDLRSAVVAAFLGVSSVDRIDVEVREMDDAERKRAAAVLRGEKPNPLAVVDASRAGGPEPRVKVNPFRGESGTRVIAVASGKGGVGKSSVTTNLAIALARAGHEVAALDADVWGFSLPRMFGVPHPPALVDDVIVPPSAFGVRLISMGFFTRETQAVVWRGPMLHKALEQFITDVYWAEPEYLLVDMPPGTGDVAISMSEFLPRSEVVVVTTPQPVAQKVAQRAAAMAERVKLPVVGVVENMSWFRGDDGRAYEIFGAGGGRALADELGVPLLGRVPLVTALRAGGDDGRPVVAAEPDSEAAIAFREIADALAVLAPAAPPPTAG